jgi:hypothetical protein
MSWLLAALSPASTLLRLPDLREQGVWLPTGMIALNKPVDRSTVTETALSSVKELVLLF